MKRPLSMTSFGRGEYAKNGRTWVAELKTVNHRYLDMKIKLPQKYTPLEERIRQEVSSLFSRGHINVNITLADAAASAQHILPNLELAREYYKCFLAIQNELSLSSPPDLSILAPLRDIITPVEIEEDIDEVWIEMKNALSAALESCISMREIEGNTLKKDLLQRLDSLEKNVTTIENNIPDLIKMRETSLNERLAKLLNNVDIDPMRLAQEAAILVDKTDVTEETVRLKSHISQFRFFLDMDEPAGRRLDFLLQEFLREINTIASKISDAPTAHLTVELKNELEKMREQVQNLE